MFVRGLIVLFCAFCVMCMLTVAPMLFLGYNGMQEFDSMTELKDKFPNRSIVVVENTLITKNVLVLKTKGEKDVFVKISENVYDSLLAEAK